MASLQEVIALRNQTYQPLQQLGSAVADIYGTYKKNERQEDKKSKEMEAIKFLQQSSKAATPEESEALFMNAYALAPELIQGFTSAQKARRDSLGQGKEAKPFQQADNGLVFDPNTGTYSVDETAKQALTQKAQEKAAEGGKLSAKDIQGINKDVTGLIKGVNDIAQSAKSLESLKSSSSPAAKLAAVFKFMKANDPTSVVRESEQGQVYEAQGAAKQLAGKLNALIGEGQLSEEGFQDLVDTAKLMANSAIESSNTEISSYLDVYGDTVPEDFKSRIKKRIPKSLQRGASSSGSAPQAAIEYLRKNPQAKSDFKAKYGYIPEGV